MIILLTILITILVIILLEVFFVKAGITYAFKFIKEIINIACYLNTYHYSKDLSDRIKMGQKMFYRILFGDKENNFIKDKTDYIFWVFYTRIFDKLLDSIPIMINRHNNRVLNEGEVRGIEKFLDEYLKKQEKKYKKYATETEIRSREDVENISQDG